MSQTRTRLQALLCLALVILLGLGSRAPASPELVRLYAGDVLWGVMFFFIYRSLWPSAALYRIWLAAVLTTELIEVSELWQAPWLVSLRSTRVGGLLLGHAFSWSDVWCVAIGASVAALGVRAVNQANPATVSASVANDNKH